jgi:DNA-binding response OmpR family regulator
MNLDQNLVQNLAKIVVVDDEPCLRELLVDVLETEGYTVFGFSSPLEALLEIEAINPQIVISDIQLPGMDGFEFLAQIHKLLPKTQRVLITAYDVDSYMNRISSLGVGNILTKGVPFNTSELTTMVEQLLNRNIFGLEKHFSEQVAVERVAIRTPQEVDQLSLSLSEKYGNATNVRKLRMVLVELMTNAIFYGAKNEDGEDKSKWNRNFVLEEHEAIWVSHGQDADKIGISILDPGGKLNRDTVLYWLDRQTTPSEADGIPEGALDCHGRGLYITRRSMDSFIINVERGKRCECIILNWIESPPSMYKSIRINELE